MSSRFAARVRALVFVVVAGVAVVVAPGGALAASSIVGGVVATPGPWDFAAYVTYHKGSDWFTCTGSVIAPNVVLTAGHCAVDEETNKPLAASGYQIETDAFDVAHPDGALIDSVVKVLPAPAFDLKTLVSDEALLVLKSPTTAPAVQIATAADTALYTPDTPVLIAGWGQKKLSGGTTPKLQTLTSNLQTDASCAAASTEAMVHFTGGSMFCTAGSGESCHGDSGGPILAATSPSPATLADWRLIGTTSWGDGECRYLSVGASVLPLSAWIAQQVAIAGGAPAAAPVPVTPIATPLAQSAPVPAQKVSTTLELKVVSHGSNWFQVRIVAGPNAPLSQLHVRLQYAKGGGFATFSKITLVTGRPYVRVFSGDPGSYDLRAVADGTPAVLPAASGHVRFHLAG
jgi:hypothetical protein